MYKLNLHFNLTFCKYDFSIQFSRASNNHLKVNIHFKTLFVITGNLKFFYIFSQFHNFFNQPYCLADLLSIFVLTFLFLKLVFCNEVYSSFTFLVVIIKLSFMINFYSNFLKFTIHPTIKLVFYTIVTPLSLSICFLNVFEKFFIHLHTFYFE